MQSDSSNDTRPLTEDEMKLTRWMLEHGGSQASPFLAQLERARALQRRCPCGCASFDLVIEGLTTSRNGCHPIADFVFGDEATMSGIFVFECDGVLKGVEVYGLAGEAPKSLPQPGELRSAQEHQGKAP
jgi:hypothetical protein